MPAVVRETCGDAWTPDHHTAWIDGLHAMCVVTMDVCLARADRAHAFRWEVLVEDSQGAFPGAYVRARVPHVRRARSEPLACGRTPAKSPLRAAFL